jgi:membrane-associated phospholipid phosphatase
VRHSTNIVARSVLALLAGSLFGACTTLPNGRGWGEDATWRPGWERVRNSAVDAAHDPWVWAPLIGAAAFQIDDWDRRTADWAREQTPVFGSQRSAEDWSDALRNASVLAHYATIAATPSGPDSEAWLVNKVKGTLVSVAAVSSTVFVTRSLKTNIDRDRPNGLTDESFPSGHTSASAVHTRLASRNLRSIALEEDTRWWLDSGLTVLTIGTSWSRIEAGWHYPSDTLVGMALGNFLASFFYDAFMGLDEERSQIAATVMPNGAMLRMSIRF